ncbi:hypothetical protein OIN60_12635 [Paenibacillus sp. P96]|uniref:Serine protease n=1 Tax=Paenibacillus zeirhizosphaerae TaxID=2987519 RepID=A0ABT9FSB6_9BACL|nr:hypothetical protein [Paenibacillus sp. P96]MDP4097620.1 hypothetical protein [Paenibacillus sp. P96]
MATFAAALRMKNQYAKKWMTTKGIFGVGIGYRDPKNHKKGAAVIIYTDSLSAAKSVLSKASAHSTGAKAPVRIVRSQPFRTNALYTRRIRPVPAGYSIGTIDASGTLGLVVADAECQSTKYMLSNNHVLNPHNTGGAIPTLQPGGADGGTLASDRVGTLYRYVRLRKSGQNLLDAAISAPLRNSLISPRYATIGVVPGYITSYKIGERLKKVGRTTGLVYGRVESIHTDVQIEYGENLGVLSFRDQSIIRGSKPISLPGDSGSVWLRRSDSYAAAVNFAGSNDGRISVSFPVERAMRAFKLQVAKPSGQALVKRRPAAPCSCTRPLTTKELARCKPKTVRLKPKR